MLPTVLESHLIMIIRRSFEKASAFELSATIGYNVSRFDPGSRLFFEILKFVLNVVKVGGDAVCNIRNTFAQKDVNKS